jgi:hypothetical protein
MASNARIFFAGIGTTFIIIGAGFGGGLMFAKTTMQDAAVQTRASSQQINPVRVILPTTAEAAEAPQAPQQAAAVPVQSAPPEVKVPEKQVEKVDTRKTEAEERARKKRYAERKARKIARQQMDAKQQVEQRQPGIMAFGGDQPRTVGFFGN